ncbi:MAG: sodium-dependent transporter [Phycisphaerae bacterium]
MSDVGPQPVKRQRWDSRTAFVMAAIGSAVGLGNVWRFPAKVYDNGGGAFFIPYIVALITAGIPLMILEMGVGRMFQGGAPKTLRRINKNYEWVGWFALSVAAVIAFYYAVVMAYAWVYLYESFSRVLPWAATEGLDAKTYFFERVLNRSTDPGVMWQIRPGLVAGLALTWAMVFLIIHKGVHRVGRVVLLTVPLPFLLLVVLGIRGLTLEGALDGVQYYLNPDFSKLRNPTVWLQAYGQVFFSLSLGFGVMIAYASYNKRRGDVTNNAFITALANCATSFIAGFVVFSVLGFLAAQQGQPVGKVVDKGLSLAFVTYPTAIAHLEVLGAWWPPVVAVVFFVTLLSLGIDSQFSIVEAVCAGLEDRFAWMSHRLASAILCTAGFLVGVFLFATRGGLGWLDIWDHWCEYAFVFVGLMQCLVVGHFFRTERLTHYINAVSEIHLGGWWVLCVRIVTPFALVAVLGAGLLKELEDLYGTADWPAWLALSGPALFLAFFVTAFLLARRWHLLAIGLGGVASWALFRYACGLGLAASALAAMALVILIGGLGICIAIARRGKDADHHERTHGWPEEERLHHPAPGDEDA